MQTATGIRYVRNNSKVITDINMLDNSPRIFLTRETLKCTDFFCFFCLYSDQRIVIVPTGNL